MEDLNLDPPTQDVVENLMRRTIDPEQYAGWILAFEAYNQAVEEGLIEGAHKLHMSCRPCYGKVYQWYMKELQEKEKGG